MFSWANEAEETTVHPTLGVKKLKCASKGHHTWTAEEIEQFNQRHPIGTQARLALDIIRYTSGRRRRATGRQHIRGGRIRLQEAKNEHRNPIDIDIPLHPALAATIAATKVGNMTFLITEYGKPFTANGLGNKFKDWCCQAHLPHCSAHAVRKATSTALADAGATPHVIMAVTGHQTLTLQNRGQDRAAQSDTGATERVLRWRVRRSDNGADLGAAPPERPNFDALMALWPTWLSYAVSHPFIAIVWANHHYLTRYADEATPRLLWFNFAHSFSMSLLPLSTAWMAVSDSRRGRSRSTQASSSW